MRIFVAAPTVNEITVLSSYHSDTKLGASIWGPTATVNINGHTVTYTISSRLFAEDAWQSVLTNDKPDLIVITDSCVLLQPQFIPGDILLIGRLSDSNGEQLYAVEPEILNTVRTIARAWQNRYPELDKVLGRGPQIALAPILASAELPETEEQQKQLADKLKVVGANAVIADYLSAAKASGVQAIALLAPGCQCNSSTCTHSDAGLLSFAHFCNDLVNNM